MLYILYIISYFIDWCFCFPFAEIDSKEWYFRFEGCLLYYYFYVCSSSITKLLYILVTVIFSWFCFLIHYLKMQWLNSTVNHFPNNSALWAQCGGKELGFPCPWHQGPQLRCHHEWLWTGPAAFHLFLHAQGFCLISKQRSLQYDASVLQEEADRTSELSLLDPQLFSSFSRSYKSIPESRGGGTVQPCNYKVH